jgi:hypothetical protein
MSQEWDVAAFFTETAPSLVGPFTLEGVEQTSNTTFLLHFTIKAVSQSVEISWNAEKSILSLYKQMQTVIPASEFVHAMTFLNSRGNKRDSEYVCRYALLDPDDDKTERQLTLCVSYGLGLFVAWMHKKAYARAMRELVLSHAIVVLSEGALMVTFMQERYKKVTGKK